MNKHLLWILIAGCAHVQTSEDPTGEVVAAERAFARDAEVRSAGEAFVAAFSDSSIAFRPGPVPGRQSYSERMIPPTTIIKWTPVYAETSSDGKLGVSTGPSEFTEKGKSDPPVYGTFVSIWRREQSGWKVALDVGGPRVYQVSVDSAPALLRTRAHTKRFAPDTLGLLQFDRMSAGNNYTAERAIIAGSGDLGYVYGGAQIGDRKRGYVRVYRRNDAGNWELIIDNLDPHVR
jgi:ketosteroid isomerase-like protein